MPPGEALALAQRLAPCSPPPTQTDLCRLQCGQPADDAQHRRCRRARPAAPFVAAGIIGPPPKPGSSNTKFYVSGPARAGFARLNDYGLIVRVLDGPLTAASALKMSYAGITKGFTALGAAMMLAATRGGSAEALQGRARRKPAGAARAGLRGKCPTMYGRPIAGWPSSTRSPASSATDLPEHAMLAAAARLYERVAAVSSEKARSARSTGLWSRT